jgi:hypothetical protein
MIAEQSRLSARELGKPKLASQQQSQKIGCGPTNQSEIQAELYSNYDC